MNLTRTLSIALLLISGGAAVFGGGSLLFDPSGLGLGLSTDLLSATPFNDYFIPGLLLLLTIGVLGIVVAILTIIRNAYSSRLTVLHGAILAGWTAAQAFLLQSFEPIQIVVGGIGFTIFCLGLFEADDEDVVHEKDLTE